MIKIVLTNISIKCGIVDSNVVRFFSDLMKSSSSWMKASLQHQKCCIWRIFLLQLDYYNRMRNLYKFVKVNHRLEALQLLWEWQKKVIKDSNYKNHRRFTLRCISKDLIPISVRLNSTSNSRSRSAKEIIRRAEKHLLQDRIKYINGILHNTEVKVDSWRSRLLSIVTTTTMVGA